MRRAPARWWGRLKLQKKWGRVVAWALYLDVVFFGAAGPGLRSACASQRLACLLACELIDLLPLGVGVSIGSFASACVRTRSL